MALMRDIFAAVRSGNHVGIGSTVSAPMPLQPAPPAVRSKKVPIQTIDMQREEEEYEEPKIWTPGNSVKETLDTMAFFRPAEFNKLKRKERKASKVNLFEWLDGEVDTIIELENRKLDKLFDPV